MLIFQKNALREQGKMLVTLRLAVESQTEENFVTVDFGNKDEIADRTSRKKRD